MSQRLQGNKMINKSFAFTALMLTTILHGNHIKTTKIHNQTVVDYTLNENVSKKFNDLMNVETKDAYKNWDHYKVVAKDALEKVLPEDLKGIIYNMRHTNVPTALVVHNMPIDNVIPPTPQNGIRPPVIGQEHGKGYVSESSLLGLCSMLDSYPDFDENEKDGTYINQIIPRDDAKSKAVASSNGSEIPFFAHTENVYSPKPLKFFSLLCLRGDPKVSTSMLFLEDILAAIKADGKEGMIEEMKVAQFIMKSGPSFEGKERRLINLPILEQIDGERIYRFNANFDRVEGANERAKEIVTYLTNLLKSKEFFDANKVSVTLSKGDLLLFNNWEVMHARDAFTIDKSNWRWLQRCYFMLNEFK